MTQEAWRPVPGYEGLYEVSDLGRVCSLPRKGGNNRLYGGKILKQLLSGPYLSVALSRNGIITKLRVHTLVLLAFVGPRPDGLQARHGIGRHLDNRLVNLCYGTPSENAADKRRDGTQGPYGLPALNAAKVACLRGHDFTLANTHIGWYRNRPFRSCRQCGRERMRLLRAEGRTE